MNTLADRIKSERKAQKLSQEKLGEFVGVSKSSVCQWESGLTKQLVGENLLRAAKALKVNPDWLSTGKGEKYPTQLTGTAPSSSNTQGTPEPTYVLGGFDLWDDDTPLREDEVALPFFREVEMAAGSGRNQVIENHGRKLRFSKATLRSKNVDPTKAA